MNLTNKREEELLQLLNDVGEDMNMSDWSKQDYCDAIQYLKQQNQKDINRFSRYHSKVMHAVTALIEYPKPDRSMKRKNPCVS